MRFDAALVEDVHLSGCPDTRPTPLMIYVRRTIRSVSDPSTKLRVALSLSKGDGSAWGWGPMRIN